MFKDKAHIRDLPRLSFAGLVMQSKNVYSFFFFIYVIYYFYSEIFLFYIFSSYSLNGLQSENYLVWKHSLVLFRLLSFFFLSERVWY